MNQLTPINGRFSKSDAERLLRDVIRAKISFHEDRIKTVYKSEEEIKQSERRIKELEQNLRDIVSKIKGAPGATVDIEADIRVSF